MNTVQWVCNEICLILKNWLFAFHRNRIIFVYIKIAILTLFDAKTSSNIFINIYHPFWRLRIKRFSSKKKKLKLIFNYSHVNEFSPPPRSIINLIVKFDKSRVIAISLQKKFSSLKSRDDLLIFTAIKRKVTRLIKNRYVGL